MKLSEIKSIETRWLQVRYYPSYKKTIGFLISRRIVRLFCFWIVIEIIIYE